MVMIPNSAFSDAKPTAILTSRCRCRSAWWSGCRTCTLNAAVGVSRWNAPCFEQSEHEGVVCGPQVRLAGSTAIAAMCRLALISATRARKSLMTAVAGMWPGDARLRPGQYGITRFRGREGNA
jgi:hypothetical protein